MRCFRPEAGLSKQERAYRASITRTYIAGLEAGMRNPSLDLMPRLTKGLGIDLADLVYGLQIKRGRV